MPEWRPRRVRLSRFDVLAGILASFSFPRGFEWNQVIFTRETASRWARY